MSYQGLWKKKPKPLSKMKRAELVKHLQSFRNAWEKVTEKNQDLDDIRLKEETVVSLRTLLKYYYSDDAKRQSEEWLDLTDSSTTSDSSTASDSSATSDSSDSGLDSTCVSRVTKKYKNRPGPPYPAKDCKGKRKRGNNGDLYKSVPDKNKVFRWKKV
jgi:hypothetical protein